MKILLDFKTCADNGVTFPCEVMPNGEIRYRMRYSEGVESIITIMSKTTPGAWQNSHFHKGAIEKYTVIKGWIALASVSSFYQKPSVAIFNKDCSFDTIPLSPHNIFMPSGSIIHTLKFGDNSPEHGNPDKKGNDWWPDELLDRHCENMNEEKLLLMRQ